MSSQLTIEKRELRQKLRALLDAPPSAADAADSLRACNLLRQQAVWKNARAVLFYAPLAGEIDLSSLLGEGLDQGKTIALPRFCQESGDYAIFQIRHATGDCTPGKFGISEPRDGCLPFSPKQLDLALAPGVGFDAAGCRLGRGRGFYDRLLAQASGSKCGVAFDRQIVERIPAENHDVHMNYILTPTRWMEVAGQF